MSPERSEDRLNRPELRGGVEPTVEDEPDVVAVAGDHVLPFRGQALRRVDAEEVAPGRTTEAVEMFVYRAGWFRVYVNAGLFLNLAGRRGDQRLPVADTADGNLRPRFRVISMVEDEEAVVTIDVTTTRCLSATRSSYGGAKLILG